MCNKYIFFQERQQLIIKTLLQDTRDFWCLFQQIVVNSKIKNLAKKS